jgi:sigma-B regulation protein RsbU (phosphoserine phosphatase)
MVGFDETAQLQNLLQEVDSALSRIDDGSFGLCEVCHDTIEADRLLADPLVRFCLDHLTQSERRALERDLDLAARIQGALLPQRHLEFGGWEIHYRYEPAGPVSGDYCDVVVPGVDSEDLYFVFGDVSGKGISASILMSHLKAIFRGLIELGLPLDELVARANRLFCESTIATHYATLVCGRVTRSGQLEVCNAGHLPPLLVQGKAVTPLPATGLPVGLFSSGDYSLKKMQVGSGGLLFLYTDGLSEARDNSDEEYGDARLGALLARHPNTGAEMLTQACLEDLAAFQAGAPRNDDLAIMAIRRMP